MQGNLQLVRLLLWRTRVVPRQAGGQSPDCANRCPDSSPHFFPADHVASLSSWPLSSTENPKYSAGGCQRLLLFSGPTFPCWPLKPKWTVFSAMRRNLPLASKASAMLLHLPPWPFIFLVGDWIWVLFSPRSFHWAPKPHTVLTAALQAPIQCLFCCVGFGPLPLPKTKQNKN